MFVQRSRSMERSSLLRAVLTDGFLNDSEVRDLLRELNTTMEQLRQRSCLVQGRVRGHDLDAMLMIAVQWIVVEDRLKESGE